MCPACISTEAPILAGAASTGRLTAFSAIEVPLVMAGGGDS